MLTMKFKNLRTQLSIILLAFLATTLIGTTATAQKSIFDVMSYQEVLSVTIEADFVALDSARRTKDKHKAKLSFEDATGAIQEWKINLTTRGNFRRMRCEMTPLKMNFKKKELKAAGLAKYDDIKLVTHCVSNKAAAKALLQKEYLAYKLYNELTDMSFRVQLLKVNYVDVNTGKKTKHWAFMIEDTAELTNRIAATSKVENNLNLPRDTFHTGILKIASIFQYMIGNADWDINAGRNVKYLIKNGKVILVPYDFDFSGLVNAPYAIPNPNFGIPSVRTRIFLGFKEDATHLNSTIAYFKSKRKNIFKTIDGFRILDTVKREELLLYIDSFYTTLNDIVVGEKVVAPTIVEEATLKD